MPALSPLLLKSAALLLGLAAIFLALRAYGQAEFARGTLTARLAASQQSAIDSAAAERRVSEAETRSLSRVLAASDSYAARLASLEPIVLRSTDRVTTYEQTPAGAAECLPADRVRSILEDRAALQTAVSAASPGDPPAAVSPLTSPRQP